MRLEGGADVALAMGLPGMGLFAARDVEPAIEVRLDADVPRPECRWLHRFEFGDGDRVCRFGRTAEGGYCYTFDDKAWLLCTPHESEARFALTRVADAGVLRFALWIAYGMGGLRHGRVPVHTSTVVCDGRAVLCLGESGTGKSTHTRLWLNHIEGSSLLNDDSPIVRADGTVYGSPWSGKTDCYRQEHFPIAALLRLEQRPENRIRRLGTIEAFTALQPSCPPCLQRDDTLLDGLVDFVGHVIGRVPAYRLGCRPDSEAAHLSHDTIYGLCR